MFFVNKVKLIHHWFPDHDNSYSVMWLIALRILISDNGLFLIVVEMEDFLKLWLLCFIF